MLEKYLNILTFTTLLGTFKIVCLCSKNVFGLKTTGRIFQTFIHSSLEELNMEQNFANQDDLLIARNSVHETISKLIMKTLVKDQYYI